MNAKQESVKMVTVPIPLGVLFVNAIMDFDLTILSINVKVFVNFVNFKSCKSLKHICY